MTQQNLFGEEEIPVYLLTIRKDSAEALMKGIKPHEFRRRFDDYTGKARVFLYVTRPVGKIIGQVIFDTPIVDSVEGLCSLLEHNSYDTKERVRTYLEGCEVAYALPVSDLKRFNKSISLEEMREDNPGFNPPMSYLKLDKKRHKTIRDYLLKRD